MSDLILKKLIEILEARKSRYRSGCRKRGRIDGRLDESGSFATDN